MAVTMTAYAYVETVFRLLSFLSFHHSFQEKSIIEPARLLLGDLVTFLYKSNEVIEMHLIKLTLEVDKRYLFY